MKKLLYITTNLNDSGGVSRMLSVKLNYLSQKKNYEIHVVNSNGDIKSFFYSFSDQIKMYSIFTEDYNLFAIGKYKKKLKNIINKVEPDYIINCDNGFKGSLLPYLIKAKVPLIHERHSGKYIIGGTLKEAIKIKMSNFFYDLNQKKYQTFVVLNENEKKDWKHNNLKVIPNPLWFEIPDESSKLYNKVAIAVGRHSIEKGYENLLEIWKHVIKKHPDWTLKIYGAKASQLQTKIEQLNISNNVKCYKPVKDIYDVYLNASMLLNSSKSETFGLTIIEAMAFGLPTISFNTSGPGSIIQDGENGYLVNKGNNIEFVNIINKLIEDEELRLKIGKNAKSYVKCYDLHKIMPLWEALFI